MAPNEQKQVFRVALRGDALLTSPRWNKGTAFTTEERHAFGLTGRLPYRVNTVEEQVERAYDQLSGRSDIGKNSFLQSMKAQNWVLYYSLIGKHLHELVPIIYTPTEAEAISQYSHLFRRSEGLFLTYHHRDAMEDDFLEQVKGRDIDLIVCSDAEAILGIGDQAIYTLIGGIDPSKCLAVTLDVGTDNEELLGDKLYVGWPHKRVRGQEYDDFMERFVQLVRKHLPHCLLHFEDFGVTNANRLLARYRHTHAVFNDDIQGTGAVTLATLMAAVGVAKTKLGDQKVIIYGAGSAGLGIARQLRDAMVATDGLSKEEATSRFYLLDRFGLVRKGLAAERVREDQAEFARAEEEWNPDSDTAICLLDVVKRVHPTVLIGTSTHAGAFTKEVIEEMAKHVERPIIFPLSNPSRLVEVHPHDANEWTGGKALLATGSPFPPAKMPSGKDYNIAECNNALVYPGLGFGAMLAKSKRVTDTMIIAGAQRLAALSPALSDPDDALLPDFGDAPDVNFEVGVAVAEQAVEEGTAGVGWAKEEVRARAEEKRWQPVYGEYIYDPEGER
ncbi:uncharacterized protein SCHCODRAFT_02644610 [Schizophyllum commune H4-8]|uniref:uncharacterized protein n=1 Tax=Schizophyllum commune (strain H4-8 / FGSC 9210) TaxID=578458 RepID=UPI0021606718|nr:uncharacterized protein SCHCODRAFT_02644610 [Schizophyllum commune H4-8]KAI5885387.1 hypothetical protein SCHCODRAFT_02644610 [Schizophyllum commune H4-8]